jgi:membrane protein DedA with SNARE-associated domain
MFDLTQFIMNASPMTVAMAIILAAFLSEDAATLTAATLAATKAIEPKLAFISAVAGIWLGDLGLYALAYRYGGALLAKPWGRRLARPQSVERGRKWFRQKGSMALFLSRWLPGTRLPVSLAAGTFQMRLSRFAIVGAAGAVAWVTLNFAIVQYSQNQLGSVLRLRAGSGLLLGASLFLLMLAAQAAWREIAARIQRCLQWEFWPAWLFYMPVAGMWIWLGIKYRGFSLPAIANPGQKNGGLVGESKAQILSELMQAAPGFVAEGFLLEEGDHAVRVAKVSMLLSQGRLSFPFVLKPNVGQRGGGFRKIHCFEEAQDYLRTVSSALIAQRYAEGPKEVGIFYVRLPGQIRGEILAITDKRFPTVIGDGVHTLGELIQADARASMMANIYLRRFESARSEVLPAGVSLRLVEAGNHCQGCVFRDGMHLYSDALRRRIDEISKALPEFYVGRYDIRYADDDRLRTGTEFCIVELNGAASEATSIYDASNTLINAYKTLFRQWSVVFEIGVMNRSRGVAAPSLWRLRQDWISYLRQAKVYPLAD